MWQEMRPLWITSQVSRRNSYNQWKGWDHLANFQTCFSSPRCEFLSCHGQVLGFYSLLALCMPPLSLSGRLLCHAQCHKPQPTIPFTLCNTGKKPSKTGKEVVWIEISCWTHPVASRRAHPIILTARNVRTNLRIIFSLLKGCCNLLKKN